MYLIGVDLGTSGCKVILMNVVGEIFAKSTQEYPLYTPHDDWSEQEPEEWYRGVCAGILCVLEQSGVPKEQIGALAVAGQMVGLVTLDKEGVPVRPCILWNDQRSVAQAKRVTQMLGVETVVRETGNAIFPSFFAPKLLWMKENEPKRYARVQHVMFPKDYINYRLTGKMTAEVSDMSGSCLMNIGTKEYSPVMLKAFGVERSFLPETLLESEDIAGTLTAEAARDTGLAVGTIVGAGGGDQACQAIGSGVVKAGMCSVTIGTSGVVLMQKGKLMTHPQGLVHAFRHAVRNEFYNMGVMLSAGGAYRWLRNMLRGLDGTLDYERLNMLAAQAQMGCEGLYFLPYLTGERCPYNDPGAKGGWIGLTSRHGLPELVRSVLEGITFGLYDCFRLARGENTAVDIVYASGGASRSALWLQLIADVFDVPVAATNACEGGAFGAAILAGSAVGVFNVAQAASDLVHQTCLYLPCADHHALYMQHYEHYTMLYQSLAPVYPCWQTVEKAEKA